jgi:hypothetical protein
MRTFDWYVFYKIRCENGDIILLYYIANISKVCLRMFHYVSKMRPGRTKTKWLTAGGGILQIMVENV